MSIGELILKEKKYHPNRKYVIEEHLGSKFGRLTILGKVADSRPIVWHCQCDCGNMVDVNVGSLMRGTTSSCGCFHKEAVSFSNSKHGHSDSRLYKVWANMKARCLNPNLHAYKDYGARGIDICDEWEDFEPFFEWSVKNGYSDDLEIDRRDNNKGYSPSNCRFVDRHANSTNQRLRVTNTSGYTGVRYAKGKYLSFITDHGTKKHLGSFISKKEALEARNNFIKANNLSHRVQAYSE